MFVNRTQELARLQARYARACSSSFRISPAHS